MRNDGIGRERASEFSLDLDAPLDVRVHFGLEKTNGRRPGAFGAIERAIRAPDQLVGLGTIIRRYRDANANAELRSRIINHERLDDGSRDTPRQMCGIVEGVDLGHDDRKLVASDSGQNGTRMEKNGDPPREFAQRLVSRGVTVPVVDRLESIKVEHENGQPLRIVDAAQIFVYFFGKEAAVGQAVRGSWRAKARASSSALIRALISW